MLGDFANKALIVYSGLKHFHSKRESQVRFLLRAVGIGIVVLYFLVAEMTRVRFPDSHLAPLAQLVRASVLYAEGRGFKSHREHYPSLKITS